MIVTLVVFQNGPQGIWAAGLHTILLFRNVNRLDWKCEPSAGRVRENWGFVWV